MVTWTKYKLTPSLVAPARGAEVLACDTKMGPIIDVGQEATGIIAIGQFASGFIAIGQVATGFIAVGQVARGFFVVGQAGFGILSLGMLSGGLVGSVGMLGAGGRGLGGILPLVPRLVDPRELPPEVSFDSLASGRVAEGFVRAKLEVAPDGSARLYSGSTPLPLLIDARLRLALPAHNARELLVSVRRVGTGFVADRLLTIPASRLKNPKFWLLWAIQLGLLFVASIAFWLLVVRPVLEVLERVFS